MIRLIPIALVLALCALPAGAQLALNLTPIQATAAYSIDITGGAGDLPLAIGFDTELGQNTLSGKLTIQLAITPAFMVIADLNLENGALSIPMQSGNVTGLQFHAQAVALDPKTGKYLTSNVHTAVVHPAPTIGGEVTQLSLADEASEVWTPQYGQIGLYGANFGNLTITSNGQILLEGGESAPLESSTTFLGEGAAVALLWDDLDPGAGGTVSVVEETAGKWIEVRFTNVPQFGFVDASTASAILYPDGTVTLSYGAVTTQDALVGITPGSSISGALPMNLNAASTAYVPANEASYEVFTGAAPFDLAGSLLTFLHNGDGSYTVIYS